MGTKKIAVVAVALMATPIAANAGLLSTDGGLGVYDMANNVTWTSNANLMATQAASYAGGTAAFVSAVIADSGGVILDTPNTSDPSGTYTLSAIDFNTATGQMDWWGAQAWVHFLDVTNYGGSNRWALPTTVDSNASFGYPNGGVGNPAQSSSQLAQLFYGGLGQAQDVSITTTHNASYSLFSNVLSTSTYWSGTEYSANPSYAWLFSASSGQSGYQAPDVKAQRNLYFALAVSPGDVNPVPLPAALPLLLSGLGGLGALARRRRLAA